MESKKKSNVAVKILDTSMVVDGYIYDTCKVGFMKGLLIVKVFMRNQLRLIADSLDNLKGNRGRGELYIINKM